MVDTLCAGGVGDVVPIVVRISVRMVVGVGADGANDDDEALGGGDGVRGGIGVFVA